MVDESKKIAIIEDESDLNKLIALHLRREGFKAEIFENGQLGLKELMANKYDLIVLDWMLPGVSGLEICKGVRASEKGPNYRTPILMLTARVDTSDVVLGLEVGADDYLTKPFENPILMARVRALLRRGSALQSESTSQFEVQGLKVDILGHKVFCDKIPVELTKSEFKLLVALLKNQGKVLSRENLISLVQGDEISVTSRTVDTHIFGLRKKLGSCTDVIETIRGVGYRVGI